MPLPEDRGFGKLFWIVAGAVLTAIVGVPLVYLVDILTPQPHFALSVTDENYNEKGGLSVLIKNDSSIASAKAVLMNIHIEYDPTHQNLPSPLPNFAGDSRCRTYSVNKSVWYAEDVSFECPSITSGAELRFD